MNKRTAELKHNELGDWVEEQVASLGPYLPAIGIGLVLAVAAAIGMWWYSGRQHHASAAAWNQYFTALGEPSTDASEAALKKVIESEKTTEPGLWARQSLADINLTLGARDIFRDRESSTKRLTEADKYYHEVVDNARNPLLVSRATFGLARVAESMFKPKEARELYEKVAAADKQSPIGGVAAKAAERLSDARDVETLEWLATQKPKLPAPNPQGRPGGVPGLPTTLPTRPDLSLPEATGPLGDLDGGDPSGLEFPAPAAPGDAPATTPPAGDDTPAPQSPDASAPKSGAAEAPAATPETPPADAKSAEAPPAATPAAPSPPAPATPPAPAAENPK